MVKNTEGRADLRSRLIAAATERIRACGLASLRTRDVTSDAGCALGALYTAFSDLDDLILQVSAATLAQLRGTLDEAVHGAVSPREKLVALAMAYLEFARMENALWKALFEHRLPAGVPVPAWLTAELTTLIALIAEPLATLQPRLKGEDVATQSRTLFSAVHGIVSMGLGDWSVGPGASGVDTELKRFVEAMVTGFEKQPV